MDKAETNDIERKSTKIHSYIIENALLNFDKNKLKYNKFLSHVDSYYFTNTNLDTTYNVVTFLDENGDEIFSSRYEILGSYNSYLKMFMWSWANYSLNKNSLNISKKILNYAFNLNSLDDSFFFKISLITSKLLFENEMHLDFHIALCSYLTKHPLMFEHKTYPTNNNTKISEKNNKKIILRKRKIIDDEIFLTNYLILLDYQNVPKIYL